MLIKETLSFNNRTYIKHKSDLFLIVKEQTGEEYVSAIDIEPCRYTYKESTKPRPPHHEPEPLKIGIISEGRKRYLTGSRIFFEGLPGFQPHDRDYCELWDDMDCMYKKDLDAPWDVWCWRRATPDEYVDFILTNEVVQDGAIPWHICQFLTPDFCKDVGFTTAHLERLRPVAEKLYGKHIYLRMIFDAFVSNGGFFLTDGQRTVIYNEYKEKRKYDYFFNRD